MRASHARRILQRGQSFHSTGASGCGAGVGAQVGEQAECEVAMVLHGKSSLSLVGVRFETKRIRFLH